MTYQVGIYSGGKLRTLYDLTGSEQFRYSKKVNGYGQFLLAIPRARAHAALYERDALARVFRPHPCTGQMTGDGVYLLRLHDSVPGDYDGLVIAGYGPEWLLDGRIYDPDDDPLVANGYSTKSGPVTSVMREIVVEQCIAPATRPERAIPGLTARPIYDTSAPNCAVRREVSADTVLQVLDGLSKAHRTDFWCEFMGLDPIYGHPRFEFVTGRVGRDRSKQSYPAGPYTYLTPLTGNLIDPHLTIDEREEKTVAVVLGQGANGNRLVYYQESAAVTGSPFARREIAVEANEINSVDALLTAASQALEEHKAAVTFEFEPQVGASGAVYQQDFDLGDIVTVGDDRIELPMRVMGIEITAQAGDETIKVETEQYT